MPRAIVDCHHHLYDLEKHTYPWLLADPLYDTFIGDYTPMRHSYLLADYLADASSTGVTKSVHVQADFHPPDTTGETEWLQDLADRHGFPHGIVAYANLADPGIGDLLEAHASFRNTRGIRQNLNWDDADPTRSFTDRGDYLTDKAWWDGFSLLQRLGLSFDLQVLPHQMNDAAEVVANHPETRVIINHAGFPLDRDQESMEVWRSGMERLASSPNTRVKLSGFAMTDHRWTVDSIRPLILDTIEIFGVERCMFASNFPVDGLYADYGELFAAYQEIVADFSDDERSALFAINAETVYRL